MVNTYDRCIENSTIGGKQCMISWYVDNNRVSRIYEHVNTSIIEVIAENVGDLTVSRGKNKKSLGMDIEFLGNGRVSLFTKDCIEESITSFDEGMDVNVSSPANKGL